jgi:tetratricopeptide (TPR) repeat protein
MSSVREEGDALLEDLFEPLDGEAGPARRISRQRSAALVMAALEAGNRESPARPRVPGKRPPVWLVVGAVLLTGAAAATVWALARSERAPESQMAQSQPEASLPESAAVAPAQAARAEPQAPASAAVSTPRVPVMATPLEGLPRDSTPPAARKQRSETPARIPAAAAPEDLLREANGLRAGGRWKDAEALYLRVIREQPSSLAAYVARVASGSLRLEHLGNARGALRQFQEALRLQPQGVLAQEVRHGIAEAWRALGDKAAEARALEDFLTHHSDSPLGTSARARLRELSSP